MQKCECPFMSEHHLPHECAGHGTYLMEDREYGFLGHVCCDCKMSGQVELGAIIEEWG